MLEQIHVSDGAIAPPDDGWTLSLMKTKIIKTILLVFISACSIWLIYQQWERLQGQFIVFKGSLESIQFNEHPETKQTTLDIVDMIKKHSLYAMCFTAFYGLVLGIGIHSIATYKKKRKDNETDFPDSENASPEI